MKKPKNVFNYVARKELGDRSNRPVEVVPNCRRAPRFVGASYCWETNGGRVINYPNAYSKKGWSNMRYVPSTLRIKVGAEWLLARVCTMYPHLRVQMVQEFFSNGS